MARQKLCGMCRITVLLGFWQWVVYFTLIAVLIGLYHTVLVVRSTTCSEQNTIAFIQLQYMSWALLHVQHGRGFGAAPANCLRQHTKHVPIAYWDTGCCLQCILQEVVLSLSFWRMPTAEGCTRLAAAQRGDRPVPALCHHLLCTGAAHGLSDQLQLCQVGTPAPTSTSHDTAELLFMCKVIAA